MGDSFKPIVEGMDFCNIDGTGWPLSVCVSNGGDILNGGYAHFYSGITLS